MAFTIDPLDSAITFVKDPDRPLSRRKGPGSCPKFNGRRDLIGRRINAIQLVVSRSRNPDEAKCDKDPLALGWKRDRRFPGAARRRVSAQLLISHNHPSGTFTD